MSRTWHEDGPVVLGTYAGPAAESLDRTRWQFTIRDGSDVAVLDRMQATELCLALAESLGGGGVIVDPDTFSRAV